MKFYRVGYLVISQDHKLIFNNINKRGLSKRILTISNLVKPTFPDVWFYHWTRIGSEPIYKALKNKFQIINRKNSEAENFLNKLINEKSLSWPNVFKNINDVIQFKNAFLQNVENLQVVCIGLPEPYYGDFLENEVSENSFDVSIYDFIKESPQVDLKDEDELLGFDVCGYTNNQFYSMICNELQLEFDKYNIKLNENSLISNYAEANQLINLIDKREIQAEEILWYPWIVIKC